MLVLTMILMQCSTDQTMKIGVTNGKLSPCPTSPNCVSSLDTGASRYVEPLHYEGTSAEARETLISVINSMKRSEIVTVEPNYIHATFTSLLFRFVDDVEFAFDDENKIIHLRSASRTGYSDLGVNRRRVEKIRSSFMSSPTLK